LCQQQATTSPACIHFPKSGHFDSMMATMFSTYMTISDLFISCTYDEWMSKMREQNSNRLVPAPPCPLGNIIMTVDTFETPIDIIRPSCKNNNWGCICSKYRPLSLFYSLSPSTISL
jgi:hypothetical protein